MALIGLLLSPFIALFTDAAAWFVKSLLAAVTATTSPNVPAALSAIYGPFTVIGAGFALLFLIVAGAAGGLRGDGRSLGRAVGHAAIWGLLSAAAPGLVGLASAAVDFACVGVAKSLGADAGSALGKAAEFSGMPGGVAVIGALAMIVGALLFTMDLVARDVVLLMVTAFAPIGLAGLIWSGAAGWARTMGRLIGVALLSKLVLLGGAAVAFSVMAHASLSISGFGLTLAAAMILGLLALSPGLLLRHAPGGAPAVGRSEATQSTGAPQAARAASTVTMIRRGA